MVNVAAWASIRTAQHHKGRHTAVSIMSSNGADPGDQRHRGPQVHPCHETVCHHVIVPAIRGGATVMDDVFSDNEDDTDEGNESAKST